MRVHLFVDGKRLTIGTPRPAVRFSSVLELVAADTQPDLACSLEGVDLSQFASITMNVLRDDGVRFSHSAYIDDVLNGLFHFTWEDGDLVAGQHQMDIRFVSETAGTFTLPSDAPILLVVRAEL